jgi:hypothetical protein
MELLGLFALALLALVGYLLAAREPAVQEYRPHYAWPEDHELDFAAALGLHRLDDQRRGRCR